MKPAFEKNVLKSFLQRLYFFLDDLNKKIVKCKHPTRLRNTFVISVGNLSMGGTGKTPMIIFLAQLLSKKYKTAVVAKGYRGKTGNRTHLISDETKILSTPRTAGDEAFLTAIKVPGIYVAVGKKKRKTAQDLAQKYSPQLILLDDGFQHYQLERNLDIVLLGAQDPFCEKHNFLREPPYSLKRADIIVFTRSDHLAEKAKDQLIRLIAQYNNTNHIFFSEHRCHKLRNAREFLLTSSLSPSKAELTTSKDEKEPWQPSLMKNKIFALSGIAQPSAFESQLRELGANHITPIRFKDHHNYSSKDLKKIDQIIQKDNIIVTTEKDMVKLVQFQDWVDSKKLFYLELRLEINPVDRSKFIELIESTIQSKSSA